MPNQRAKCCPGNNEDGDYLAQFVREMREDEAMGNGEIPSRSDEWREWPQWKHENGGKT